MSIDRGVVPYRHIDFAEHVYPFYGVFEGDVLRGGNDDGAFLKLVWDRNQDFV